jgi:alkyl sulfatase BDS1-like metallo-beta-lactamase superfamily hydrolase
MNPSKLRFVLSLLAIPALAACGEPEPGTSETAAPETHGGVETRDLTRFGEDQTEPYRIADGIFQAHGVGNQNLVVTSEGNVVIDTGLPTQSDDMRELLRKASDAPTRVVIVTHAHADHAGGVGSWLDDDPQVIAHRTFPETQRYLVELIPFFMPRNKIFYPGEIPDLPMGFAGAVFQRLYPVVEPTLLVDDRHDFELGGVRFEVLHTPGAEGEDSISVWLPDAKVLFIGDFVGPLFPMFPNLYTIRGEKFRFAVPYIESLDRLIALEPEIIVPSHFLPISGRERIRADLTRMRDATAYVHDAVVEGMNDGKDVYTLMREIRLPPELELSEGHGKVAWTVRGIWEGYSGWFQFDRTAQLYAVNPASVHPEVVEMAGGASALAARAQARTAAGEPVEALHLLDMALAAEPSNRNALMARLDALELLLERSGGVNHSEVRWLENRMDQTRRHLGVLDKPR